jgi:ribonucleotide reductase alpha subunit
MLRGSHFIHFKKSSFTKVEFEHEFGRSADTQWKGTVRFMKLLDLSCHFIHTQL